MRSPFLSWRNPKRDKIQQSSAFSTPDHKQEQLDSLFGASFILQGDLSEGEEGCCYSSTNEGLGGDTRDAARPPSAPEAPRGKGEAASGLSSAMAAPQGDLGPDTPPHLGVLQKRVVVGETGGSALVVP